jgi:hypothetical protein
LANLFKIQGDKKRKSDAAKHSTSEGGLGATGPRDTRKEARTPGTMGAAKPTADSYSGGVRTGTLNPSVGSSLMAMDANKSMRQARTGNIHGIVSTGAGETATSRSLAPATKRKYPDLSQVPRSQGGTGREASIYNKVGEKDLEGNRERRGLRVPGQRAPSLASKRPDAPLAALLKANAPRDSEQEGEKRKARRAGRTKQPAPSTMLRGVEKLG